ncbi:hypothetical protein MHO82_25015 [Vibrio sp. Of7-15]|uniref:hypothetical protein n=1 Tax=Vibrio sp. Of7-15 TaxID=2724879 RepID=UPI001EF2B169|nr:hypothetical protein [Vibrio sp. Of7-15]MCG7500128.1 hypothetical protein [Vibrio sp. Of7-15]
MFKCPSCKEKSISVYEKLKVHVDKPSLCNRCHEGWRVKPYRYWLIVLAGSALTSFTYGYAGFWLSLLVGLVSTHTALIFQPLIKVKV